MSLCRHMSSLEFIIYQLLFIIGHATNVPNFSSLVCKYWEISKIL